MTKPEGLFGGRKKVDNVILQWHVAVLLSGNKTPLVYVDLIGERNKAILEAYLTSASQPPRSFQ